MGSKAIVFVGLFLAIVLIFTSEVTARDLAETSTSTEQSGGIDDAKHGGSLGQELHGHHGHHHGHHGGSLGQELHGHHEHHEHHEHHGGSLGQELHGHHGHHEHHGGHGYGGAREEACMGCDGH